MSKEKEIDRLLRDMGVDSVRELDRQLMRLGLVPTGFKRIFTEEASDVKETKTNHYKLCYIDGQVAYFTTRELSKQWGDDWEDIPYEHNAGAPCNDRNDGHNVIKRYFESSLVTPDARHTNNSPYSVQKINRKEVPWLSPDEYSKSTCVIFAGEPLDTFIEKIKSEGGEVYAPLS